MSSLLEELAVRLKFETDKKSEKEAHDAVSGISGALEGLANYALGEKLFGFFEGLVEGAIEAGSEIQDMSERLGIAKDAIQTFSYAANQTGASTEEATGGLRVLSKLLQDAADGGKEAAKQFYDLGVAATDGAGNARPVLDVVHDIADAFDNLEEGPEKANTAMGLFGRAGLNLIPLLNQGSDGLEELYNEAYALGAVLDDSVINALDDAGDELVRLKAATGGVKMAIGGALAPEVERLSKWVRTRIIPIVRRWIEETNFLKYATRLATAAVATFFGRAAMEGLKVLGLVSKSEEGFGGMLRTLLKLGPTVGIVVALALAAEDLYTWIKGGDSLAEEFFTKFLGAQGATELVTSLREAFKGIEEGFRALAPVLATVVGLFAKGFAAALPYIAKAFDLVLSFTAAILEAFGTVGKLIGATFKLINGGKGSDFVDEVDQAVLGNKSTKLLDKSAKRVLDLPDYSPTVAQPFIDDPTAAQRAIMPAGGPTNNSVQQSNNITINVASSQLGQGVAGALRGALGDERQAALAALGGQ